MKPKALVVDDDAAVLRAVSGYMQREGYVVSVADGAPTALSTFEREKPFDVLVCDVHLEAGSGWKVADHIYSAQPSIAVLMISGAPIMGAPPRLRRYGSLQKPFDQKELRRALNDLGKFSALLSAKGELMWAFTEALAKGKPRMADNDDADALQKSLARELRAALEAVEHDPTALHTMGSPLRERLLAIKDVYDRTKTHALRVAEAALKQPPP